MELLYPAYQKFYSALSHLHRFDVEKDFFSNISCLDTFFSEFRNITFVLKKSLRHTSFFDLYEKCCNEYLSDCEWLREKRNETIKEAPFPLIKNMVLTVYYPSGAIKVGEKIFDVRNDISINDFLSSMKAFLVSFGQKEVFFSIKNVFYEDKSTEDIYEQIMYGIRQMDLLLKKLELAIPEKSTILDELKKRILSENISLFPKDFLGVRDYVFYPEKQEFEKADRYAISSYDNNIPRIPISNFDLKVFAKLPSKTVFEKFILMNAAIGSTDLMPTMMIIYNDDTFVLDTFHSSLKTTFYRKINEIAELIEKHEIKEVFYMTTYVFCAIDPKTAVNMISKERLAFATNDYLTFMRVSSNEQEECAINGNDINTPSKVLEAIDNRLKKLCFGANNLLPIIKAFEQCRKNKKI